MTLAALGQRLREERLRVGLDQRAMAAAGGVSRNSQLAYEAGRTAPSSEYLLAVQQQGVDVAFLFTGARIDAGSSKLGIADDADWIMVPAYQINDAIDGERRPIGSAPFRRDWLNQALGTERGLWLTELPCDYPAAGLLEGNQVLCRDVEVTSLHERNLCIWRDMETMRLFVGRFSAVRSDAVQVDSADEYWVGHSAIAAVRDQHPDIIPIARILARPIVQIR